MWIHWALLSAVFAAFRRTSEKQLANKYDSFVMGLSAQITSLPILALAYVAHGVFTNPFSMSLKFWLALLWVGIVFYPLNSYLYLRAIRHSEISSVLPIQSLGPVFGMLTGYLLLNESLAVAATVGLCVNVIGVYALGLKGRALHNPLAPFKNHDGSRYMLYVTLLQTLVGLADRIALQESDPTYFGFWSTVLAVIVLTVIVGHKQKRPPFKLRLSLRDIAPVGLLQGATYLTYLLALVEGPLGYVGAVRSTNILMGSILGAYLLKERFSTQKQISLSLLLGGTVLIAVGSD